MLAEMTRNDLNLLHVHGPYLNAPYTDVFLLMFISYFRKGCFGRHLSFQESSKYFVQREKNCNLTRLDKLVQLNWLKTGIGMKLCKIISIEELYCLETLKSWVSHKSHYSIICPLVRYFLNYQKVGRRDLNGYLMTETNVRNRSKERKRQCEE